MKVQELITENIGLKLLALFIALLLWLNVNHGGDREIALIVPVTITNIPPHLHVELIEPAATEVRIVGPKILMWQLDTNRVTIALDAAGVSVGTSSFTGLEKRVNLPRGFHVSRISPSTVTVKLSKAAS